MFLSETSSCACRFFGSLPRLHTLVIIELRIKDGGTTDSSIGPGDAKRVEKGGHHKGNAVVKNLTIELFHVTDQCWPMVMMMMQCFPRVRQLNLSLKDWRQGRDFLDALLPSHPVEALVLREAASDAWDSVPEAMDWFRGLFSTWTNLQYLLVHLANKGKPIWLARDGSSFHQHSDYPVYEPWDSFLLS